MTSAAQGATGTGPGQAAAAAAGSSFAAVADAIGRGRDVEPSGAGQVVDIGPARLDPVRSGPATTVFIADTGRRRIGDGVVVPRYVATASGAPLAVVSVVAWQANELHVEVDLPGVIRERLTLGGGLFHLFAAVDPGLLRRLLPARLAGVTHGDGGVASSLLAAVGRDTAPPLGIILGPAERRLGPLVEALGQLIAAGRSVLLASADPLTLDHVLVAGHHGAGAPPPGVFVRVGVPATTTVARDERLTLDSAAAALALDVVARRHELGVELRRLTVNALGDEQATTPSRGASTTAQTLAALRNLERARQGLDAHERAVAAAVGTAAEAAAAHARARTGARRLDPARAMFERIDELGRRVEQASGDATASAAGVGRLAGTALSGVAPAGPKAAPAGTTEAGRQLVVAAEVASARIARRDEALGRLREQLVIAERSEHRRADIARADRELAAARTAHARAERAVLRARAARARAVVAVAQLADRLIVSTGGRPPGSDGGDPTTGPGADAAAATAAGSWPGPPTERVLLPAGLELPRAIDPQVAASFTRLTADYAATRRQLVEHHADAIARARVVAAPLDQLVANPALYQRRFDNVIVEGAGTLPAALVLWITTRADRAVTLTAAPGDRPPTDGSATPGAFGPNPWRAESLLSLFGLSERAGVAHHPGGMVLG